MAAAIGIRLPIMEPIGNMVIDIGGGTSDISVISLGGVVRSKNLRIAGGRLNNDIIAYIRSEFKIFVWGETAEDIKKAIGRVIPCALPPRTSIKGRALITS